MYDSEFLWWERVIDKEELVQYANCNLCSNQFDANFRTQNNFKKAFLISCPNLFTLNYPAAEPYKFETSFCVQNSPLAFNWHWKS